MTQWLAHYEADGELWFRIGRDGDDLVAEWLGIARLIARRDGSAFRLEPDPEADPRELAKIERGSVQLLLRHLRGKLALHGAAIAHAGNAVILLGRAKQGKSTLAAALCARDAIALLSDDAVAVDPAAPSAFVVTALEKIHWLDAAARSAVARLAERAAPGDEDHDDEDEAGKRPVLASTCAEQAKLIAIVDLVFVDGPARLARVSPLEAMAALVPQAVRFVLDEPAVHRREIEQLGRLVDAVPAFRLERPRSLTLLSQSCDLVSDLFHSHPASHE